MNTREEKMANGPILKTMFEMGLPTFVAQLVNLLYNVIDRIFIGHIPGEGAAALTGVGVSFPIIVLVSAFAMLVGAGGAPLAGIALGKGDRKEAEQILGTSAVALTATALILTVVFQLIKRPFLYLFGASDATYPFGGQYLQIYLMGTIFVMLVTGLNSYITVQGATVIAMASTLIGAFLNLILDPIFIFVLNLGVRGAATATIISQACSAIWIIHFLTSEKATLRIKKENLKLKLKVLKKITSLGISPFIMNSTESLISIIFNSGAQHYGNDLYVGSVTILQSAMQMVFVPLSGFSMGVQPIISYNYGAKNKQRVKKVTLTLIVITFTMALAISSIAVFSPRLVVSLFSNDAQLVELCSQIMPIYMFGMLIFGLQNGCQNSFMALGKAKQSLFFALLRKVFLLTPLALILPAATGNVMGLFYAEPISDIISAISCFTVFLITLRGVMRE